MRLVEIAMKAVARTRNKKPMGPEARPLSVRAAGDNVYMKCLMPDEPTLPGQFRIFEVYKVGDLIQGEDELTFIGDCRVMPGAPELAVFERRCDD